MMRDALADFPRRCIEAIGSTRHRDRQRGNLPPPKTSWAQHVR